MKSIKLDKLHISVFLLWLIHISGIIGILSGHKEWFLDKTPLNLISISILSLINVQNFSFKTILCFFSAFIIGFSAEFLGVNYGYIFGHYIYGENLGYKIGGVPLTIGLNWAVLTFITYEMSARLVKHRSLWVIPIASLLMLALDIIIEPSTAKLDFWYWDNNHIPYSNYMGWFFVSLIPQFIYYKLKVKTNLNYSIHAFVVQILFFMLMLTI